MCKYYHEQNTNYWEIESISGKNLGSIKKISSFLYCKKEIGDIFSLDEIRHFISNGSTENLGRRLRELREIGWSFDSYKNKKSLSKSEYVLNKKGDHPKSEIPFVKNKSITEKIRRTIFERDGYTCKICGITSGSTYSDSKETARITVGHKIATSLGGTIDIDNLQTECARCNEPVTNKFSYIDFYNTKCEIESLNHEELSSLITLYKSQETSSKLIKLLHVINNFHDSDKMLLQLLFNESKISF